MRSTSMTTPMLTLPQDALSEVALKLPAVKSTKPWRDLNSLATTCKHLYQWKKTVVDINVETEWKRVSAEVAQTSGWRDSLEKILSDFEDPSIRLFREPILRKITEAEKKSTTAKSTTSLSDFNANLNINRETASFHKFSRFLTLSFDKKMDINKKNELLSELPSILTELKSIDRQQSLEQMFKWLDTDTELGASLKKKGFFKKIGASLDGDEPSEVLLELSLRMRGLLTRKPDLSVLEFNLEYIPPRDRWNWLSRYVPEFFNTTLGSQVLLNDFVCRHSLLDYLDAKFSVYSTRGPRLELCEQLSPVYSKLFECYDGEKLAKKLVHWFLKEPIFTTSTDAPLTTRYIDLLIEHIALVKTYFGEQEKKLFKEAICQTIQYVSQIKAYEQFTSILKALAKDDTKLLKNLNIGMAPKAGLKHALDHAKSIKSLDIRYSYVDALYNAACLYSKVDPHFVNDFYIEKEVIRRQM